jgi:hypothetical protein
MDNITQRSIFDSDIKAVAAQLQDLVTNNASHADIVMTESRLRELVAARREHLYEPKDPSYYIDKVFAGASVEDRRKAAEELEGPVTAALGAFIKEETQTQEGEFLNYDLLNDILAFLRFFKNRRLEDSAQGYMEGTKQEHPRLVWGNKPGLTVRRFCEELVQRKFIDRANANLLEAVLTDYKSTIGNQPTIHWDGSLDSLTTFLIMGQYLGILNPETAPSVNRPLLNDVCGIDHYPVPPVASIMTNCFTINDMVDLSNINRGHAKPIILDLEIIELRVRRYYETQHLGPLTPSNFSWDDVVPNLFRLLEHPAVGRDRMLQDIDQLDIDVLAFYSEMISQAIIDRGDVANRLATAP